MQLLRDDGGADAACSGVVLPSQEHQREADIEAERDVALSRVGDPRKITIFQRPLHLTTTARTGCGLYSLVPFKLLI